MKIEKYVFLRHESKYKLTAGEYKAVLKEIRRRLSPDEYGETTIQSLYYDTDNWRIIRNSIEKPLYKEKLRARSYGLANPDKKVFLELKKKCDEVVFKRRISIPEKELAPFINCGKGADKGQIEKEIGYFCNFYGGVKPSMLLLYDRIAYLSPDGDLRVTFDRNIRYRTQRLDLCSGLDGTPLLPDGEVLMEIKTGRAYPRWLIDLLNKNNLYKTSFSKYGTAYKLMQSKEEGDNTKYLFTEDIAV